MENLKKRAKAIKILGCVTTLVCIVAGICFIVLMGLAMSEIFNSLDSALNQSMNSDSSVTDPSLDPVVANDIYGDFMAIFYKYFWLSMIMSIAFGITGIGSLVGNILILATDWKNKTLNDAKLVWGLLGILLLGGISGWVFGQKAKNVYAFAVSPNEQAQPSQETSNL